MFWLALVLVVLLMNIVVVALCRSAGAADRVLVDRALADRPGESGGAGHRSKPATRRSRRGQGTPEDQQGMRLSGLRSHAP